MDAEPKENGQLTAPVTDRDHRQGSLNAPIILLEYGDYECPTCLNAVPIIQEVQRLLGDRLCFIFRHFPRSSIHPHASVAAEAAEAAGEQGKFWEMHFALFKHQQELGEIDFSHLALGLGLEIYQFQSSQTQEKHRRRIRADFESGEQSGVTKTPTFFINGRRYDGPTKASAIIAAAQAAASNH